MVLIPSKTGQHSNEIFLCTSWMMIVLIPSKTGQHSNATLQATEAEELS